MLNSLNSDASTPQSIGNTVEDTLRKRGYNSNLGTNFAQEMAGQSTYLKFFDDMTTRVSSAKKYRDVWLQPIKSWIDDKMEKRSAWYDFISSMKNELSGYEFHRKKKPMSEIGSIPSAIDIAFLERIGLTTMSNSYKDILRNSQSLINARDEETFHDILKETLEETVVTCDGNKMTVTGTFVKASEFMTNDLFNCGSSTNVVLVFARRKIFMDMGISSNHRTIPELYFISPHYEIVKGSGSVRISLDGESAPELGPSEKKAADGSPGGHDGQRGQPGRAGISGGRFVGITDEAVGGTLYVTANGGRGSGGQAGGSGTEGTKGGDHYYAEFPTCQRGAGGLRNYCSQVTNGWAVGYEYWCYKYGDPGSNGGNGGAGGKSGGGGFQGEVQVINAAGGNALPVTTEARQGNDGEDGNGGSGGEGGLRGVGTSAFMYTDGGLICGYKNINSSPSTERSRHGDTGAKGGNRDGGNWQPARQNFVTDAKSVANQFVTYAKDKLVGTWGNDFVNQVAGLNL